MFRSANAFQPRALEQQGIDRHQRRAAGHGQRRHLGADPQRVEPARRGREGDDVVGHRPEQVLVHLAQGGPGEKDRSDDVVGVALHEDDVGAFNGDVGARADRKSHVGLGQRRCVVDAVSDHSHAMALRLEFLDFRRLVAGKHVGVIGKLGCYSFNGNKIITTGGGGAILTADAGLAARAKHLTTTAKVPHRWAMTHDEVGFNYRLPNINAALGCAQLEQLPGFVARKRALAERYRVALAGVDGVRFLTEPAQTQSNYWLNALMVEQGGVARRDELLTLTHGQGLGTRPVWTLLHRLSMYRECPRTELPVAERLEACVINLPSSAALCPADTAYPVTQRRAT